MSAAWESRELLMLAHNLGVQDGAGKGEAHGPKLSHLPSSARRGVSPARWNTQNEHDTDIAVTHIRIIRPDKNAQTHATLSKYDPYRSLAPVESS